MKAQAEKLFRDFRPAIMSLRTGRVTDRFIYADDYDNDLHELLLYIYFFNT